MKTFTFRYELYENCYTLVQHTTSPHYFVEGVQVIIQKLEVNPGGIVERYVCTGSKTMSTLKKNRMFRDKEYAERVGSRLERMERVIKRMAMKAKHELELAKV